MNDFDVRWIIGAGILLVFILLMFGLWAGWRAKGRAQAGIPDPVPGETVSGEPFGAFDDVHYVATTLDERPLERIVRGPLAFRGRCRLEVLDDGVRVAIRGAESFAIPAASIRSVGARTATIDRAVERDGLTTLSWTAPTEGDGDAEGDAIVLHTSFRIVDRAERERAAAALARLNDATTTSSEES